MRWWEGGEWRKVWSLVLCARVNYPCPTAGDLKPIVEYTCVVQRYFLDILSFTYDRGNRYSWRFSSAISRASYFLYVSSSIGTVTSTDGVICSLISRSCSTWYSRALHGAYLVHSTMILQGQLTLCSCTYARKRTNEQYCSSGVHTHGRLFCELYFLSCLRLF